MRLIDADALMGKSHMFTCNCDDDECEFEYIGVRDVINAPTIDAAPVVHARWEKKDESEAMFDIHWMCSKCGQEIVTNGIYTPMNSGWHYCPCCGAKMDGGENDA